MTDEKKKPQEPEKPVSVNFDKVYYLDGNDAVYYIDADGNRVDVVDYDGADILPTNGIDAARRAVNKLFDVYEHTFVDSLKMKNSGVFKAIQDAAKNVLTPLNTEDLEAMRALFQPAIDLLDELRELEPYINAAAEKEDYTGLTFSEIMDNYTPGELLDLLEDPASDFYKTITAARATRDRIDAQNAGRAARRLMKQNAAESGAIMELKGGNYTLFSNIDLWNAFSPERICKMGTLPAETIDTQTGLVKKRDFEPGEIEELDALEVPLQTLMLLNGIMKNSVDNVHTDFVKDGTIRFYVKGVLEATTTDPRSLLDDQQLNLERKTAGVLYLESQFEPLQGYIGTIPGGSRYSVFNYIGYDANTDTMEVQMPYLYQLWRRTQQDYFTRQKSIATAQNENKKPAKKDFKPLETNDLFKRKAYTENETTLEIAIYITNVMLAAGNGDDKKATLTYKTIINNCPRLKQRLDEITARPNTEILEDGKKRNNTAIYNGELRKIKNAFTLIQNPDKCDALSMFEFIDIKPATKNKKGVFEMNAPTKSMINDKITIKWRSKNAEK